MDENQSNQKTPGFVLRNQLGMISQEELGDMLGVSKGTLREWRKKKKGPDFVRVEKSVFYRLKDVEAWVELNTVPTSRVA